MKKIRVDFRMERPSEVAETCIDLTVADEVYENICIDKQGYIFDLRTMLCAYCKLMGGYRFVEVLKITEVVQSERLRGEGDLWFAGR